MFPCSVLLHCWHCFHCWQARRCFRHCSRCCLRVSLRLLWGWQFQPCCSRLLQGTLQQQESLCYREIHHYQEIHLQDDPMFVQAILLSICQMTKRQVTQKSHIRLVSSSWNGTYHSCLSHQWQIAFQQTRPFNIRKIIHLKVLSLSVAACETILPTFAYTKTVLQEPLHALDWLWPVRVPEKSHRKEAATVFGRLFNIQSNLRDSCWPIKH